MKTSFEMNIRQAQKVPVILVFFFFFLPHFVRADFNPSYSYVFIVQCMCLVKHPLNIPCGFLLPSFHISSYNEI